MREIPLLSLLIFLPIAHGAVEVWSVTVMHIVSIVIFALWIGSLIKKGYIKLYRTPIDIPLMILAIYLIISSSLSVYPYSSRIQLYKIINYIAIFYLLINTLRDEKRLASFSGYLAIIGALYGIAGVIFITEENFLGLRVFSSGNFLSFTFKNHNHFAGYMNMIVWLCIGMAFYYRGKKRLMFIIFATTSVFTVFLSLSRGGIIGLFGGVFFFSVMNMLSKNRKAIFMIITLIAIITMVLVSTGSFDTVFERMMTLKTPMITTGERLKMWIGVLNMIKDNPIVGTGIGTFAYAYPAYQTVGGHVIDHAHNEYLEIISETGLIGGLLLFFCIAMLFGHVIRHSVSHTSKPLSGIGLGALTACFSLLLHEFFDFNLYIPSNAFLFTVCAGVALASALIYDKNVKMFERDLSKRGRAFCYSSLSVIFFISLAFVISPYIGSIYQNKTNVYQMSGDYTNAYDAMKKAIFFEPGNAELMSSAGDLMVLWAFSYEDKKERESFLYKSIEYYNNAIRNVPVKSYFYRRKAYALKRLGKTDEAGTLFKKAMKFSKTDNEIYYELAELYLETGRLEEALEEFREYVIRMQGVSHLINILDRIWEVTDDYNLLMKGVPEDAAMRDAFANYLWKKGIHDAAIKEFAYAYELAPSVERALRHLQYLINTKRYREGYNFCKKYLRDFKDNIQLYKKLLWFSKRIGKLNEALLICEKLADLDSRNRLSYELEIARIYCDQKNWKGAFDILEKIRYNAPNTPELYFVMAECYRGRRMFVQALKAREKAVLLRPNDPNYLFNLGFDYRANGLHDKALESWRQCVKVNPSHKGCREWVKRYENDGR